MGMELEPIERASEDELRALQLQRLRWSVRHTYENVSLYRRKCEGAGVHPHDLRTLADLERFPFMQKDDLRAGYPFGLFAVPREQVVLRYARGHNFNGSQDDIAGVVNQQGNVMGLMPHPEHAVDLLTGGSTDGDKMRQALESIDRYDGLIKTYAKPFTPENHDALNENDYIMVRYNGDDIVPVATQ